MPQHTLLIRLEDHPGALHRAVTLFRRRKFNIAELDVRRSDVAGVSNLRVVVEAPSSPQVINELDRLVDVLSVQDISRQQADGVA